MELLFMIIVMIMCIGLAGFWDGISEFLKDRKNGLFKLKKYVFRPHIIDKPWGHEELWANSGYYAGKLLFIKAGHRLSKQYHRKKVETIMVLRGEMYLDLEWKKESTRLHMTPGDIYNIHQKLIHRMTAISDVIVVEVSTCELNDVKRVEDDYNR
jgi:quercetin dioxygenase-like cupin family protein